MGGWSLIAGGAKRSYVEAELAGCGSGEPVTSGGDFFGAAVQLAARLCERAAPGAIVVSNAVRELAIGKDFRFGKPRQGRLKGFDEPVRMFEVQWQRETL